MPICFLLELSTLLALCTIPVSIHNRTVSKMETFTEMEGGSMESAVAFDLIDSDDSEDGATTIAIRGQIDSVVNTLDTYDNTTSDSDNTQSNDVQDNANPNNNTNGNGNSDVDFDADEIVRTDDEDDNNDPDEEEDNSSGFGIHRSVNLVEQIDELSESGGELSLDDGIHDDFTNASLDNRDTSLLDDMETDVSEGDRSTQENEHIQHTNAVPIQNGATHLNNAANANGTANANDNEEEVGDLFTDMDGFFDDPRGFLDMERDLFVPAEWKTENFDPIHVNQFKNLTGFVRPSPLNTETATPIDYFQLYITDSVFQTIVDNTNKYQQYSTRVRRARDPTYKDPLWMDVGMDEMKAYFGLAVLFGVHNQPRYRNYWSSNPLLGNAAVQKVMTLRRYQKISEYLHVSDREKEHPRGHVMYSKLAKIQWLLDLLNETFPRIKHPSKNQSVDEGVIAFTGRCEYVQFNSAKPTKRGIKTYIRTCADDAYCQQLSIYLGKDSKKVPRPPGHKANKDGELGVTFITLWEMVKDIQGHSHHVYFDNWYTGIPALRFLFSKRIYSCGTIKGNSRLLPPRFKNKNLKFKRRGMYETFQSERLSNLTATLWQDTKMVKLVSTLSDPTCETRSHRRIGGSYYDVPTPSCAKLYNKHMSGVDRLDRLVSKKVYGSLGHGARKVWRHILWYLVNLCIANAYIVYKDVSTRQTKANYDHMAFRLELAQELIAKFNGRKRAIQDRGGGGYAATSQFLWPLFGAQ